MKNTHRYGNMSFPYLIMILKSVMYDRTLIEWLLIYDYLLANESDIQFSRHQKQYLKSIFFNEIFKKCAQKSAL